MALKTVIYAKQGGEFWDAYKLPTGNEALEMADHAIFPQVQAPDQYRAFLAIERYFGIQVLKSHEFMMSSYHDRQVPSILVKLDIPT